MISAKDLNLITGKLFLFFIYSFLFIFLRLNCIIFTTYEKYWGRCLYFLIKSLVLYFMNNMDSDIYIFRDLTIFFSFQWSHCFKGKTCVKLVLSKVSNFSPSQCFPVGINAWSISCYGNVVAFFFFFQFNDFFFQTKFYPPKLIKAKIYLLGDY